MIMHLRASVTEVAQFFNAFAPSLLTVRAYRNATITNPSFSLTFEDCWPATVKGMEIVEF